MLVRSFVFALAAAWAGTSVMARAQTTPPEPRATLTIQLENDSTRPRSDSYYTSGERIAYTSPAGQVPGLLADFGHAVLGDAGTQRMGLELSQYIFTPFATGLAAPPPNDRPYAAILMGTVALIQDAGNHRTALALGIGVTGPAALGRDVQNGWHELTGQVDAQGWHSQTHNQPVVQLTAERTWRVPLSGSPGGSGVEVDVLPSVTAGAGTFRIYGQAGGRIRVGQGLDADFGVPRLRPGMTGTDAYTQTRPVVWYLFAGADAQAVGWDETLDGLPFERTRHVSKLPLVAEFEVGVAVIYSGVRFTAAQVFQTNEFRGQHNGMFQFTSASLGFQF